MHHDGYVVDHGILPRDYGLVNCVVSCPFVRAVVVVVVSYFLCLSVVDCSVCFVIFK
jgi:hypothetical protein